MVEIDQETICANLDVLLKLQKKLYLRVGLFFQTKLFSSVNFIEKDLNGKVYYSYGNEELEKNYSETTFQSGFCLGVSIPFKLFNNQQKFNITYNQIATPIVNTDYTLYGYYSYDVKVLSVKARPGILSLGFDINLQRNKKKKTEED